ncbi:MAG: CCA tRNA nucleotidyltransferase [Actinomycetota bacterium]
MSADVAAAIQAVLDERLTLPPAVDEIAERFQEAGHQLFLVGGAIRDALLGRLHENELPDLDFATDATPDVTRGLLEGLHEVLWTQGEAFGSIGFMREGLRYEITTFRADAYAPASRKPAVSEVADIETDLSRRDFTVNAMALSLPDRRFLDPLGGIGDLHQKLLRTPGSAQDSFTDDPLRMVRAARFVSQLGLAPAPEVIAAMKQLAERLDIVAHERIREEFSKLMTGTYPSIGLELLTEAGLSDRFLPELAALKLEQDPIHRHKDVYRHSLAVLDKICAYDSEHPDLVLRLAGLLHDIGKPSTRKIDSDGVSFHHHDVVGARMATERLQTMAFSGQIIQPVAKLIELHLRFHTFKMGWSDSAVRRYARDAGDLLDRLNILVRCDCTTRNKRRARELEAAMDEFEARLAELREKEDLAAIRPPIDGNEIMEHLGIKPGPLVGKALAHLLEIRLEEGEYSRERAFEELDAWAKAQDI